MPAKAKEAILRKQVERATLENCDWFLNPLQSGLAIPKKAQNALKISATVDLTNK